MGFAGIRPGSLLLILLIIVLLFGTGRLRNIGKDLGEMTKSFREGFNEIDKLKTETTLVQNNNDNVKKTEANDSSDKNPSNV